MLANPTMIAAGAAGALTPLALHLLSRARCRTVGWGAMMFVKAARLRQRKAGRLLQWLLLALRMLTVGLLGVALARPRIGAPAGADRPRSVMILLDRSASMGLDEHGRSRMDLAREAAFQILSTLGPQDQAGALTVGQGEPQELAPLGTDLQEIERRVAATNASASGKADLAAGLATAARRLSGANGVPEIYVVSDQQAASWDKVDQAFGRAWQQAAGPRVYAVAVGSDSADNVAIESVQVIDGTPIAGLPAQVRVTLKNYGPTTRSAVPLRVWANAPLAPAENGRPLRTSVHVDGNGQAAVTFLVVPANPGTLVIEAQIRAGGLAFDKHDQLAVDVASPVQVLVITGDDDLLPPEGASQYLRAALMPFHQAHLDKRDPAVVTVASQEDWPDLDPYQVVVLANVPDLSVEQVRALEQFVYDGGGLVVSPGEATRLQSYNAQLWREGRGILPARLDGLGIQEAGGKTQLGQVDLSHPVFRFLGGRPEGVPGAVVRQYVRTPQPDGDAQVLGRYADGDPFLIESASGRGHVMLVTTSLDASWNDLPLTAFYLPLVQSAVRELGRPQPEHLNVARGEELVADLDETLDEHAVELTLPGGRVAEPSSVQLGQSEGHWQARYALTQQSGVYRMRVAGKSGAPPKTFYFVVQGPRGESDLTVLTDQQWGQLEQELGLVRLQSGGPLPSLVLARREGHELSVALVGAVMLLSMMELAAGRLAGIGGRTDA